MYVAMRFAPVLALIVCVGLAVANADGVVLHIDSLTGCTRLNANTDVSYADDQTINALKMNRSSGGDVENCLVCDNFITVIVPPFDASNVLADMPVFKGDKCTVKYEAADDDAADDEFMCPPFAVGDGRMTANEQCDDGNAIDGDGCSSAGVLQDASARSGGFLRYQAVQNHTQGDGFVSGTELYDISNSLTNHDDCKGIEANGGNYITNDDCPVHDQVEGQTYFQRLSINELSSYEVLQNGWKAPNDDNDKFAYFEISKVQMREFKENIHVQVLASHPSVIDVNRLVQTTNARKIVIQCVPTSGTNQAVSSEENIESVTTQCGDGLTTDSKMCMIANSAKNDDIFIAGSSQTEYDTGNSICGVQTSLYNKIRVYVLAEQSGNVYVKHTVRTKGQDKNRYIDYPSLIVLNFRAHITAADISQGLSASVSATSLTERENIQTVSALYSQTVELDGLSDAKFVRTVYVHANYAVRYDNVTSFSSSLVAKQNGKQTMYFGNVAGGAQDAASVFTIPAYENSPAQLNLLKFDALATLYSCDQFDGSTAYTPVEEGSIRTELTFTNAAISPYKFSATDTASNNKLYFDLKISKILSEQIVVGQFIKLTPKEVSYASKQYQITAVSSFFTPSDNYYSVSITVPFDDQQPTWGYGSNAQYIVEFIKASQAGRFGQFVSSDSISIESQIFEVTQATNPDLTYLPSSLSISEGSEFDAKFTWQLNNDVSLTRTWDHIECCDIHSSNTSYPTYATSSADVSLITTQDGRCFKVTSAKNLFDTINRNDQLNGEGITVTVTPCTYATQAIQFECSVKVIEPVIENSQVDLQYTASGEASKYQFTANDKKVDIQAIVQTLSVDQSFVDLTEFTLEAGDPSSVYRLKVCTFVNDTVRNSGCDESEYVNTAALSINDLKQESVNGNSYWVLPSFLSAQGLSAGANTLSASPTFATEETQTVCFEYDLTASSRASTCGNSSIEIVRSHSVKEDNAPADTAIGHAYLKINEASCKVKINSFGDLNDLDEDGEYELSQFFNFHRNKSDSCGQHEDITEIKFTINAEHKDNVFIAGHSFGSDSTLTLSTLDYENLGDKYSSDNRTFVTGKKLTFKPHFNTQSNPTITLNLEITVSTCDGDHLKATTVTRQISVNPKNDECYQDAVSTAIETDNQVTTGNVIAQVFNATLSHIDERRFYEMTIISNVPLSYQITRGRPLQNCGSNSYGQTATCTLYCSPDGSASDKDNIDNWDDALQCKYLKDLLIVPLYDSSAEQTNVVGFPYNCPSTEDSVQGNNLKQSYCTAETGGVQKDSSSIGMPYNKHLFLKFTSSIAVSNTAERKECNYNGKRLHHYDILSTDIIGEVTDYDGNNAVDEFDAVNQMSSKQFDVNGSDINNNAIILQLNRTVHAIYNLQQNGMYILLNVTSSNCLNEDDERVDFDLTKMDGQPLDNLDPTGAYLPGFSLGSFSGFSAKLVKQGPTDKHVVQPCQIKILADQKKTEGIFAPFYTHQAEFIYNVQAAYGRVVVQLGGSYTPFDTPATAFTVYFARIDGSDGILEAKISSDVLSCSGSSKSSSFNGHDEKILRWENTEDHIQSVTVNLTDAQDCAIKFKVDDNFADSQTAGQPGETWLTGDLGSLQIGYSDDSANFASQSLLLAAGHEDGQEFIIKRTKYEKPVMVNLTVNLDVTITPKTLIWAGTSDGNNDNSSKTIRVLFNKKNEIDGLSHLRIDAQMIVKGDTDEYDKLAGSPRLLTDENNDQIPIVDDLSPDGQNACKWGKIESVITTGNVVSQPATSYSSFVDGYVRLSEGADHFMGVYDTYQLQVSRPTYMEGKIQFKLNIATFNQDSTGVFALSEDHLQQKVGTSPDAAFVDFGEALVMDETTSSITISIKVRDDEINNGMEQLGLLFVTFEPMLADLQTRVPSLATDIVAGCNNNAAAGTPLHQSVQDDIQQATSARRLLSVVEGKANTTILKVEDDVTEPFRQVQTSEDFSIEYWSNATLLEWNAAMNVAVQFDVPNFGDKPFGAWAQIGSCPTNVSSIFTQRASCSTFKPINDPAGNLDTPIKYVRALVGLDPSYASEKDCTGQWPCALRYTQPDTPGFQDNSYYSDPSNMDGHTITIDADGNTRPVYPYKYENSLTELEKCTDTQGQPVVSTTSSNGDTAYTFKTCIVTYSPRFKDRTDSDVILKTAEQTVMLSSTNEAVVTAIMFETSDSIRVSMVPRQKSCLSTDVCTALTNDNGDAQYTCPSEHTAFLELETFVDVPLDEYNTYGFTGPVKIEELTQATNGGCHYNLGAGNIVYRPELIVAHKIERQIDGVTHKFARTKFYLRTPCFSADTGSIIASNVFSTCPADQSKNTNYDFKVQMASCTTEAALQSCAQGDDCEDCIMTGNRQELTVIKSDVTFIEQLPSVDLGKKTAMQLVPELFKYGSSQTVTYNEGTKQSFTTKDTLVLAIRPEKSTSFEGEQFALTCPDKYLAAYNPISPHCTTSKAVEWTFKYVAPLSTQEEADCVNGQACKECDIEHYSFPIGLAKQSVLFDGARKVRICENRTHILRTHEVAMMDFVHTMWIDFYANDWRADPTKSNCADKESCRQTCDANSIVQADEGCSSCMNAGAFGAGQYVLPILAATPLVRGGKVVKDMASLIVDDSSANVQVCKHSGAEEGNPDSYGNTTGYDEHNVCNSTHPLNHANKPRYCGFPGLNDSSLEFSPYHPTNPVYVSAGISLFCGALTPDRLYSISAHCYITNCQADSNTNSNNYVRRLLQFAEEHDVVVDSIEEQRHVPAAGAKFFKIEADTTTTTDTSDSDVIGLGSTIAITLGVVALVVIALLSVSWIFLYRRAYGHTTALPMTMPVQQQRQPLLYQSGAQSEWNF